MSCGMAVIMAEVAEAFLTFVYTIEISLLGLPDNGQLTFCVDQVFMESNALFEMWYQ